MVFVKKRRTREGVVRKSLSWLTVRETVAKYTNSFVHRLSLSSRACPLSAMFTHRYVFFVLMLAAIGATAIQAFVQFREIVPANLERVAALDSVPQVTEDSGYVSSNKCRSCHPDQYASWHRSFHRTMTQLAEVGCVVGEFAGQTVESDGLPYTVHRRDGQFWATMPDPEEMMNITMGKPMAVEDVPLVERRVVMTTGSHHYQTYWVTGHPKFGNLLQTLPLVYLIEDQRWIPREAAFVMAPGKPRMITQWNHHCIKCHSTGGNPGLLTDVAKGRFSTEVGELGISCEACHGPGHEHVVANTNPVRRYGLHISDEADSTIVNPEKLDHARSSQVCGQCHGSFVHKRDAAMQYARKGIIYHPGGDLHATRYYPQHPVKEPSERNLRDFERNPEYFRNRYWGDGTMMVGGREYTALQVTKCFTEGQMSCLSCHSMHHSDPADQLKPGMRGNEACTQCHEDSRFNERLTEHTHHSVESDGSNCLNCHMPHNAYALFSGIRNHQIETPRVAGSVQYGVPNACNLCHLDQTLAWTQDHMSEWYDYEPLMLTDEQATYSAAVLWMLKGNAAQRVVSAWHVGWQPAQRASGTDWQVPIVANLLADPYGVVRYVAAQSIRRLPGTEDFAFDFLASDADRSEAQSTIVAEWVLKSQQPENAVRSTKHRDQVMIGANGEVLQARVNALLSERDDTPMNIQE